MIRLAAAVAAASVVLLATPARGQSDGGVAFEILDLTSGRQVQAPATSVLARPSTPGTTMNLLALIAALEDGSLSLSTRIACPGYADLAGRRIACPHPRVRRSLTASEALSYACNTFFASVGERLSRSRFNAVSTALGLPPAPSRAPMALVATGIAASPVPPSVLLRAFTQVVSSSPGLAMSAATRRVVLEGLRGAAVFGTAGAFAKTGVEALAYAGTAQRATGGTERIVLAAWPASAPTRAGVVVAPAGIRPDAVERAASLASTGASRAVEDRTPPRPARGSGRVDAESIPASGPRDAIAADTIRVGSPAAPGYSIRVLPLEDYVAHVLAGEAAPHSTPAALEALAITVRTFALANRGRHARDGFDLCDSTHCQVLREPYAAARAAAAATEGQILTWEGRPASVYYTASCGGHSEVPSSVWPGADDPPYLPAREDDGCGGEPKWDVEIPADDLRRALVAAGLDGPALRDLRVRSRSGSGRVTELEARGMAPGTISGQALRMAVGRTLGWTLIKSTDFRIDRTARGYRFSGRGFGHGVGFCVIGATKRSARGESRARLLADYFPGLQIETATASTLREPAPPPVDPAAPLGSGEASAAAPSPPSPPLSPGTTVTQGRGISVTLPDGDERDRPYVTALIERALASAAARVGRSAPAGVAVVFHATTDSFERATGEPSWSAALTIDGRVHLQPIAVLRDRRSLEDAIAHELGHVVTAPALQGRARWVQEGAAMFAAGELPESAIVLAARDQRGSACPSDGELRRARSAAAADRAYARARQCFARALAANLRWDEVR